MFRLERYLKSSWESICEYRFVTQVFRTNSTLKDVGLPLPDFNSLTEYNLSCIFYYSPENLKTYKYLDPKKITGPDNVSMVVLKNINKQIFLFLAKLCYRFLKKSMQNLWKVSSVCLVFKNADECSFSSKYRPISLLGVISNRF